MSFLDKIFGKDKNEAKDDLEFAKIYNKTRALLDALAITIEKIKGDKRKKFAKECKILKKSLLKRIGSNNIEDHFVKSLNLKDRVITSEIPNKHLVVNQLKALYANKDISLNVLEESLRKVGEYDFGILSEILTKDENLSPLIIEEYLSNTKNYAISYDYEKNIPKNVLKEFGKLFYENPAKFKEKFSLKSIIYLINLEEVNFDFLDIFSSQEIADIFKDSSITEEISKKIEASLSQEKKEEIVWLMSASNYFSGYNVNLLAKWLPEEDRVKYFSENIPRDDSLCYGFMDEKLGIFSLIGMSDEVLTLDQLKEVMKNYEPKKNDPFYDEMFESYEKQLAEFEKKKE